MQNADGGREGGGVPLMQQEAQRLMRALHISRMTEEAYVRWIDKFLRFHKAQAGHWRHPTEMSDDEFTSLVSVPTNSD